MTSPDPIHLNPATEVAERVLLPGDPQRALAVSQALLEAPKMMNARRGLWGYTGTAPDGGLVTVQSTGMGGPSAALVLADLAELGVRRAVRIGTCAALSPALRPGDLICVAEARAWSGDGRGAGAPAFPDGELTSVATIAGHMQAAGLEVRHEETLREHYAMTLRDWCRNLDDNWDAAVAEVGEGRARVWALYMAGSRLAFEKGDLELHQVLGVNSVDGVSSMPLRPDWGV